MQVLPVLGWIHHGHPPSQEVSCLEPRSLCPSATQPSRPASRRRPRFLSPGCRSPIGPGRLLRILRTGDTRPTALRSHHARLLAALLLLRRRLLQPQDRPGLRTQPRLLGHRRRRPPRLPHHQRFPQGALGTLGRVVRAGAQTCCSGRHGPPGQSCLRRQQIHRPSLATQGHELWLHAKGRGASESRDRGSC